MAKRASRKNNAINLDWKPDKNSSVPLYMQITNYFCEKITKGDWVNGQLLPSQRKLSKMFDVNRSTVVQAMEELAAIGIVASDFGGGTKIVKDSWSLLLQNSTPDWQSYIHAGGFRSNIPAVQTVNRLEFEENIIRLSTGEISPEILRSDVIKKTVADVLTNNEAIFANYPDPLGMLSLRKAVCEHLKNYNIEAEPSGVLIVSGALQALSLISVGIISPGSKVFVESPSYLSSLNLFQSAGARLEDIKMDNQGILPWMIKRNPEDSEHSLLYTIPNYQNPTGIVMSAQRRQELIKYCMENNLPILEDDVLCDLWFDNKPPDPIKSIDRNGNVVYISSLSKSFAPGLRVGWVTGSEAVVRRLADVKMQMDYGVSTPAQIIAERLLKSGLYEQGMQSIRQELNKRKEHMLELLQRYFGSLAQWNNPQGGLFLWLKLNNNLSADKLYNLALKEGLLLLPGSVYGKDYASYIRLSFGYMDSMQAECALKKLAQLVKAL